MTAKRPKLDLLPSLEQLKAERIHEKSTVTEVKQAVEVLKNNKLLDLSARRLKRLPEETKISWLLATEGITKVTKLCSVIRSLPIGITDMQRAKRSALTSVRYT